MSEVAAENNVPSVQVTSIAHGTASERARARSLVLPPNDLFFAAKRLARAPLLRDFSIGTRENANNPPSPPRARATPRVERHAAAAASTVR